MEVKTKEYRLHDKKYYFRMTAAAGINFERLMGYPPTTEPTFQDTISLAYVGTIEGMKDKGLPFEYGLDEYIALIDTDVAGINKLFEDLNPEEEKKKK